MKQLVLLVGLHKTATSSIQQSCAANQKALAQAGLPYPVPPSSDGRAGGNHTEIFNWFRRHPERSGLMGQLKWTTRSYEAHDRDVALEHLAKVLAVMPARILMAAEGVSLFSLDELLWMRDWFAGNGWRIRTFIHVRHLYGWMNSMVAQRATGGMALSIAQAIAEYVQYGSIVRRRIENILQAFPDARAYSHEAALRHPGGPVGFFLHNLGVDPASAIKFVRANEGSGDRATRVLSLVYERFGRFDEWGELSAAFFGNQQFIDAIKALGGRKFVLQPSEAAPLMQLLQADNEWLRQTLGEEFHDPHQAFENGTCDWTPDALAQLRRILAATPPPVGEWVRANIARLDIAPAAFAKP